MPDVQSVLLLLVHCAQARATCLLRALPPTLSEQFARSHDAGMNEWVLVLDAADPS